MNFTNVGFRRNAKEMEVRKDFARLRSLVDDTIGTGLSDRPGRREQVGRWIRPSSVRRIPVGPKRRTKI